MKRILFCGLLSLCFFASTYAQYGTERTGYEGDYFSLEGAIQIFKEAHSLRDFERRLNSEKTWVNNLDLDFDGQIDYIRVEHRRKGDFHAIVLQVPINRHDVQDVAVIEIEKIGRRDALLQIIGDRDLYGEELIVEPLSNTYSSTARGARANYVSNDYVNVYYWPIVQSFYQRNYRIYRSPYHWSYYPTWWSPWRQYGWNVYYPRIRPYNRYCQVVTIYRTPRVHKFYQPHRRHSHHVYQHTQKLRIQHHKGHAGRSVSSGNDRNDVYGKANRKVDRQPAYKGPRRRLDATVPSRERATPNHQASPSLHKPEGKVKTSPRVAPNRTQPGTKMRPERNIAGDKATPRVNSGKSPAPAVRKPITRTPVSPKVSKRNNTIKRPNVRQSPVPSQGNVRSRQQSTLKPTKSTGSRARTTIKKTAPPRSPSTSRTQSSIGGSSRTPSSANRNTAVRRQPSAVKRSPSVRSSSSVRSQPKQKATSNIRRPAPRVSPDKAPKQKASPTSTNKRPPRR